MLSYGFNKFHLIDSMTNLKGGVPSSAAPQIRKSTLKVSSSVKELRSRPSIETRLPESPTKQKSITRSFRHASMRDAPLHSYLNYVQANKQQSLIYKRDLQRLINDFGEYVHQLQEEFRMKPSISSLPTQIYENTKFKRLTSNNDNSLSEPSSYRKKSILNHEGHQQLYNQKNEHQINELIEQIKEFHLKLEQLRRLWQNDQRVEKFIRLRMKLKPELKSLFFPNEEESNLLLSQLQMIKLFRYKDQRYGYDKYHFAAGSQLKEIIDTVAGILEQNKIQELMEIKRSIQEQKDSIRYLEESDIVHKFHVKKTKTHDYLSFESPLMQNQNKDILLDKIERLHGSLQLVTPQNRRMNNAINQTLETLKY